MTTNNFTVFVLVGVLRLVIYLINQLDDQQTEENYTNLYVTQPERHHTLDDILHDIDESNRQCANQYFKLKPVTKIGYPRDIHTNHKFMSPIRRNP